MSKTEKIAIYLCFGIIIGVILMIAFSENGWIDYKDFKLKEAAITEQAEQLQRKNKALEHEIQSLQTDLDYIKHLAKHEHDMAEEGELIFKAQGEKKEKAND